MLLVKGFKNELYIAKIATGTISFRFQVPTNNFHVAELYPYWKFWVPLHTANILFFAIIIKFAHTSSDYLKLYRLLN